ncbi:MAG: GIY-YIG nuclease family protein [Bauldia sp.]|nr:GIY-YIG nuclease family protein [Bauldia sp.]
MSHVVYIARGPRGALRIVRRQRADRIARRSARPTRIVHYELFRTAGDAIVRERQLKAWQRQWMVDLVELVNPGWEDLTARLCGEGGGLSPDPTCA